MRLDLRTIPSFGVAGNFTGHLEQAGEAADFAAVKTAEAAAPKALFPTYIPASATGMATATGMASATAVPEFLRVFPFDSETIIFPKGEERLQIEPECAVVFAADWQDGLVRSLSPVCFGASNDCSIRKPRKGRADGIQKISEKKNWGACSKGFSARQIALDSFCAGSALDGYRIASFLVRGGEAFPYGEDSPVSGYSYIWERLTIWLVEKLNFQKDEGPAEDVHSYLLAAGCPRQILVSIGATRYTDWGEHNFLQDGDASVVILYPEAAFSPEEILRKVESRELDDPRLSVLWQAVRA